MSTDKSSTQHTKETINQSFLLDFRGIFTIAELIKRPFKPLTFKFALAAWVIFSAFVFLMKVSLYDFIVDMVASMISFIPGILGFTIGGYSFLIGFIQSNLMQKISEPRKGSVFSLFQVASASFACNIILQALSLIIAFIVHFIILIDSKKSFEWRVPHYFAYIINIFAFLLIGFAFAISLAVILQIIINVFNFSQLHHYNTNKEKLDLKQNEAPPSP